MNENKPPCSTGRTWLLALQHRSDPNGTLSAFVSLLEPAAMSLFSDGKPTA